MLPAARRDVWTSLYDDSVRKVYGYLMHRCGDGALAQDLTQETFLSVAKSARRDAVAEPTVAWVISIARNKLIDHWRRAAVHERSLQAVAAGVADTASDEWEDELEEGLALRVLAALGPSHRAVLTLRYLDGLSIAETAKVMQRTSQATQVLLSRARMQFRRMYEAATGEDSDD